MRDALQRNGRPETLLDQRAIMSTEVELVARTGGEGWLRFDDRTIDLGTVKVIYVRPQDRRESPGVVRAGRRASRGVMLLRSTTFCFSFAEMTSALALNWPSAMAANGSKPFQAAWIESLGFRIPDTFSPPIPTLRWNSGRTWPGHSQVDERDSQYRVAADAGASAEVRRHRFVSNSVPIYPRHGVPGACGRG